MSVCIAVLNVLPVRNAGKLAHTYRRLDDYFRAVVMRAVSGIARSGLEVFRAVTFEACIDGRQVIFLL